MSSNENDEYDDSFVVPDSDGVYSSSIGSDNGENSFLIEDELLSSKEGENSSDVSDVSDSDEGSKRRSGSNVQNNSGSDSPVRTRKFSNAENFSRRRIKPMIDSDSEDDVDKIEDISMPRNTKLVISSDSETDDHAKQDSKSKISLTGGSRFEPKSFNREEKDDAAMTEKSMSIIEDSGYEYYSNVKDESNRRHTSRKSTDSTMAAAQSIIEDSYSESIIHVKPGTSGAKDEKIAAQRRSSKSIIDSGEKVANTRTPVDFTTPRKSKLFIESDSDDEENMFGRDNDPITFANVMSSTRMHTEREVQELVDSDGDQNDVIEINGDDDEVDTNPSTLASINQPLEDKRMKAADAKKLVSKKEYDSMQASVVNCRVQLFNVVSALNRIDLTKLPDNGAALKARKTAYEKTLAESEAKLKEMTISPQELKPAAASWADLQKNAGNVMPRTFGKQAMATFNEQKQLTLDSLEDIHKSLKTCPTEEIFAEEPKGLKVSLMPHQRHGLAWLMWRENQRPQGGILADDMGLGKTLMMLSLVAKMNEINKHDNSDEENEGKSTSKYEGGTLVVCPTSLISQWEGEIKRRFKRSVFTYDIYHGPKRETSTKHLSRYTIVITTYAIVMNEGDRRTPLTRIRWNRIILDEAHQIRNYKSQTAIAICNLKARNRWSLTGTPVHNKETDLYSLLKFLRCAPFDDYNVFRRWISEKSSGGQERLNTVMSSLILRRTKQQLQIKGDLKCLPERTWELIEVQLEKDEMDIYQRVLIFSRTLFAQYLHQRAEKNHGERMEYDVNYRTNSEYDKIRTKLVKMNRMMDIKQHEILVLLLRLRQICNHPTLIAKMLDKGEIDDNGSDDEELEAMNILEQLNKLNLDDNEEQAGHSFTAPEERVGLSDAVKNVLNSSHPVFNRERKSSKIKITLDLIKEKAIEGGDKMVIVSQWKSYLDLIALHLKEAGIEFKSLDGSVPVKNRGEIIDAINNQNSHVKVLLLSLTAGGVGLNLVGANHLVLLDLHWNPQLELQAQDRIYRVGQEKHVFVYKLMATGTIEERIKALQEKKKAMAESLLTGAKIKEHAKLTIQDLKMLFNM